MTAWLPGLDLRMQGDAPPKLRGVHCTLCQMASMGAVYSLGKMYVCGTKSLHV